MPAKNTLKIDVPESYYHVFARGVAKQLIFLDDDDYSYFRHLFARYLSLNQTISKAGVAYPHLRGQIELLAYCQMRNHFHLLVYQQNQSSLATLMRGIMTAYSKYFNLKYKRTGPVFETRYKAVRITTDAHLMHITRYIHLNPRYYKKYQHSSYQEYVDGVQSAWLQPDKIQDLFPSPKAYAAFCEGYVDRRDVLQQIKNELADY